MEADGGLVKNIEDALEAGADLGGEADALGFAARESGGATAEFKIIEADVLHKADARLDFFDDWRGDEIFVFGEFEV